MRPDLAVAILSISEMAYGGTSAEQVRAAADTVLLENERLERELEEAWSR